MRHLIFSVLLFCFAVPVLAVTPVIIQHSRHPNQEGNGLSSLKVNAIYPTLAGNTVFIGVQYGVGSGATVAESDNNADTFTTLKTNSNSNQTLVLFCAQPTTGTITFTTTWTGGTPSFASIILFAEVDNITSCTADKTFGASGSSTSVAAGSQTTTVAGDFIVQIGEEDGSTTHENWTAGSGFTLLHASRAPNGVVPDASQWQQQPSAGAINPTLTMSAADSWDTVAAAMFTSSAGTAPPLGMRILGTQDEYLGANNGPFTTQFPCAGNLIAVSLMMAPGLTTSGIASASPSLTFTQRGGLYDNGNNSNGGEQNFDSANVSTCDGTMNVTISTTGTSLGGSNVEFLDIAGAATAPFDKRVLLGGTQSSAGNFSGTATSPSVANGIIVYVISVASPSITGIAANGTALMTIPAPFAATNDPQADNNGFGFFPNPGTSSYTVTWTDNGAVQGWSQTAVAYEPPSQVNGSRISGSAALVGPSKVN
jgi:hypothetical protein